MSRLCLDCGIAPWQDCQCDPRAGLDHPDVRNFRLREDDGLPRPPRPPVPVVADFEPDPDADLPF